MSFDNQTYIELFYQDAEEHINAMTDALLDLENDPGDKEAIGAVFRAAHTMKSSSAMVGFMHISEFTHKMEDLIGMYRDTDAKMDSETVTVLFRAFDVLKDMLSQLQDGSQEEHKNETNRNAKSLITVFQQLLHGDTVSTKPETVTQPAAIRVHLTEDIRIQAEELKLEGEQLYEIGVQFKPDTPMVETRAFMIQTNLSKTSNLIKTEPDVENEGTIVTGFALLIGTKISEEEIMESCQVGDVENVSILNVTAMDQFEWNDEQTKEVEVSETKTGESKDSEEPKDDKSAVTSFDRRAESAKTQTVRVSIDKLDRLLNLTAEMVIQRGRAQQLVSQLLMESSKDSHAEELAESITQQSMILSQLQETIMETRMVPIGMIFSRFRRVVRDLAHSRNKQVDLIIDGEETELDKKIIDQLNDPLTHMIRNSMDHGIETPEERKKAGKNPTGTLHLNAFQQGNNIVISIRDDGKGIDANKIREKGIEKGLVTAEEAKAMSDKEAIQMIFRPGFSMAKEVTDISGRGVGMDVVRRSIEHLGGSIEVDTKPGMGSTIYLKVPLTLAIIQALLVESSKELYALPISSISETIRISKADIYSVKGKGKVFSLREHVVPLINLQQVVQAKEPTGDNDRVYVAILRHGDKYVGLIVDRMVNEQEVVIKSLDNEISKAPYIAGASILGDGRVILILDTVSLIDRTLGRAA
jgi:two-component system chemotaxis sensor kinase CheA